MIGLSPRQRQYLGEVERALLNAPFGGDWRPALAMIATATHSQGVDLVSLGGPLPSLNVITGYEQAYVDEAFGQPELWGEVNWRVGVASTPFKICYEADYDAYRERIDTRIYDEVAHATQMPYGCQTLFAQDESGFLGLALMRNERQGRCTGETLAMFDRLSRVVSRAINLEATLAGDGAQIAMGEMGGLERSVILVNRHGWRCALSPLAEAMLIDGRPIQSAQGRLRLAHPHDNYRFQQLLAHLLSMPPRAAASAGIVSQGYRIQLTHLPMDVTQLRFEPMLAIVVTPDLRPEAAA